MHSSLGRTRTPPPPSLRPCRPNEGAREQVEAASSARDPAAATAADAPPPGDVGLAVQLVYSHTIQALRGLQFLHDELRLTHGSVKLSNLLLAGPPAGPPAVRLAHMHAGEAFPPTCKGATRCRSPESLESGRVAREDDMFAVGCCVAAMATGVVDREKGIKGHFGNSPPLIQASGSGAALHLCRIGADSERL